MPRRKKTKFEPDIEEKLNYLGLDLDKIPKRLMDYQPLKIKHIKTYDEKKYIQYRYILVKDIQILITPTNRLENLDEKLKKARPLVDYIDNQKEDNLLRYTVFLNMIKQINIEEIEKISEKQEKFKNELPFNIKFQGNYLWQVYYSEESNKYFMLVPMEESDYSALFYLIKKKIDNKENDKIYVPICNVNYSTNFLRINEYQKIEDYLRLLTKNWPQIYEVYDENSNMTLYILGETCIYGKINSIYKIVIKDKKEANYLFKLLKAMFILQTEIPNYFLFETNIEQNANLLFYCQNEKVSYSGMANFIKEHYSLGELKIKELFKKIETANLKLENLKQIASMQEIEYIEKEKQISTFLECKKTFFGKVKYYFKYSKKNKKGKIKEKENDVLEEKKIKDIDSNIEFDLEINDIKALKNHTIEELIDKFKELEKQENVFKNIIMDINAIKLKNKNMAKKIENAKLFIEEIDKHKRSIFEFWKYSNKDEISVLPEGEEEAIGITKTIEKTFDYEQDFETYGEKLDEIQREKLSSDETDSIYILTTNILETLNKVATNRVTPKDIENVLKELKKEQKEKLILQNEDYDIFSGLLEEKNNKIGNKVHREFPKDKFNILEVTKMTRQIGFKLTLEQITKNIKNALKNVNSPDDITIYKAIIDEKIDENQFNIFNVNPEEEIKEVARKEGNIINLYKINLKKGQNIIGFTNNIFYDNQNNTLPLGMNLSSKVLVDISKIDMNIKKKKEFQIACLENEEDEFSNIIIKKVLVYE